VEPCIAGTIVIYARTALESDCGRERVGRALQRLSSTERQEILDALPVSWIRHTTLENLYREAALQASLDPAELHANIVRRSIEHRVRHVWRILLRLSGPNALANRAKMIYEKSYSVGRVTVGKRSVPGQSELAVHGWPMIPEMADPRRSHGHARAARAGEIQESVRRLRVDRRRRALSHDMGAVRWTIPAASAVR
jgi:hypothetical protein